MTTSTLETCSVPVWVVSLGREKHCLSSSANARTRSLLETRFKGKSSGVRTAIDAGKTFGVSSLLAYSLCVQKLCTRRPELASLSGYLKLERFWTFGFKSLK